LGRLLTGTEESRGYIVRSTDAVRASRGAKRGPHRPAESRAR